MGSKRVVRHRRKRDAGRNHKSTAPKPRQYPGARYLCTARVAGYPVHYFEVESLGNDAGQHFNELGEVYIVGSNSPYGYAETLMHETLHAANIAFEPEATLSEAQVTTLSVILTDVLARNDRFREGFLKLLKKAR